VNARRAILQEIDTPEWAPTAAARRLVDVEYVGKMEAVAFRFEDGRIFGVPLEDLEGIDGTPVARAFLVHGGDAAVVEQFSGNRLEVPWDVVLHHADPAYPCRKPEPGSPEEQERRQIDRAIGERVPEERPRLAPRLRETAEVGIVAGDDRHRQRYPA
jgi:hypothetical protein